MKYLFRIFLPMMLSLAASCGSGNSRISPDDDADTVSLSYSRFLKLERCDGFDRATVISPWDTTRILNTYILVPDLIALSDVSMPDGTVIRVPIKRAVVYSSVHTGLLGELGAYPAVKGICDGEYMTDSVILGKLRIGEVVDCGHSTAPTIEKIISLEPDAIFLSPYEGIDNHSSFNQIGMPLIECADFAEPHPLGRAEWMKFYGMLVGKESEANRMFKQIESEYLDLKQRASAVKNRPTVVLDLPYGASWFQPGRNSNMGMLIDDAGGRNIFDSYDSDGTLTLSAEKVLHEGGDADLWLIRYFQSNPLTLKQMAVDNALAGNFKAFRMGNVYGCNTATTDFFTRFPFKPHELLREMISVIHPELIPDSVSPHYFVKVK